MRAVIQRVQRAEVRVGGESVGAIGEGLLVLLGVEAADGEGEAAALARKIARLRIFPSEHRPIDRSLLERGSGGAILVVSQFTLCADTSRGHRPSFLGAAAPEVGERLYELFCAKLREDGLAVRTGRFGAMMEVELVNDGPVTIVL
ncbi:MAG: D-tyrosyl-tRNA(Tyr) deacylase [Planctomycetes bacterium]|nr:D-tyrosyl-tRNA(Tyr) deacylase [Planctomycetota bacterium]